MKTGNNRDLNPAIMTCADAAKYLGCSLRCVKSMKQAKRLKTVSFGTTSKRGRYVTRESVERVLRGEA